MTNNVIHVPGMVEAVEFWANQSYLALRNLEIAGRNHPYNVVFMPEIIDAKICADKEARIWQKPFSTPGIRATGRTKQGTPIVVYAHVPNYFSEAGNILKAMGQGLVDFAGKLPKDEFQRLLDLEDNERVFVADYNALRNSTSGFVKVKDALNHPQTIPFLGGEERAIKYLKKHEEFYRDEIGIFHLDDLYENPVARHMDICGCGGGLVAYGVLGSRARFIGVRTNGVALYN